MNIYILNSNEKFYKNIESYFKILSLKYVQKKDLPKTCIFLEKEKDDLHYLNFIIRGNYISKVIYKDISDIQSQEYIIKEYYKVLLDNYSFKKKNLNLIKKNLKFQKQNDTQKIKTIFNDKLPCYNLSYFKNQLNQEIEKFKRFNESLSVLSLEVSDLEIFSENVYTKILEYICEAVNTSIRAIDILFYDNDKRFYVLLHNTIYIGSLIVAERIRKKIFIEDFLSKNLGLDTPLKVSIAVYTLSEYEEQEHLDFENVITHLNDTLKIVKSSETDRVLHYSDTLSLF